LYVRGSYKPIGVSGKSLRSALITLSPEIYGSITDPEKVELTGLLYVMERLPKGIEECRFIRLISREGLENSNYKPIVPPKRVRNCYRVDEQQMFIEMTRGRSDIYDILTHLTFIYNEAEKIKNNSISFKRRLQRNWLMLEEIVNKEADGKKFNIEQANTYLSILLGRTYEEVSEAAEKFATRKKTINSLFHIIYWLGKVSIQEELEEEDREITFGPILRERLGHHIYGELWADNIKKALFNKKMLGRPIHIISANPHSVLNSLYSTNALNSSDSIEKQARFLSASKSIKSRKSVKKFASRHGLIEIEDTSGTNLSVQIIDTVKLVKVKLPVELNIDKKKLLKEKAVLIVMDYAFGEQAFETMDELLKPYIKDNESYPLNIRSISIIGKAGILEGGKGDIMIPTAHVFEGTADNYPFNNDFNLAEFEGHELRIEEGPMVTVLGTSLQNRDILKYFQKSSWNAIGLEMEGAFYQKAIQSAALIRKSIDPDVKVRYAYYASDNPLKTGSTLASGSLGLDGVKPTYLITKAVLKKILG